MRFSHISHADPARKGGEGEVFLMLFFVLMSMFIVQEEEGTESYLVRGVNKRGDE